MSSTEPQPVAPISFAYQAQTEHGQPLSGTIDAEDAAQASRLLESLRLRVIHVEPVARPPRSKPLRGEDFLAFNQQLTHLTRAGLPVEQGLRLIAQDQRSGKLAATVRHRGAFAVAEAMGRPYVVQERVPVPAEPYPSWVDGELVVVDRMLDTAPFVTGGAQVEGMLTRLSTAALLNVTAGGGSQVPNLVVEPRG